ncbi:cAMP-regulated phosphoprotein 19-like [Ornithodoros turicata]|uniref:cAMP-regulated phosphoprotein 19-like n=1 Tax=Ornithodoros turicata TaxID=34597 RepID=UPI003139F828
MSGDGSSSAASGADDAKPGLSGKDEEGLRSAELEEEAKFKSRYPQNVRPGGSLFLQKRLNKGQKYFDSGDYNMAKAKGVQKPRVPPVIPQNPTGETIPTVESLPPRKASLVQSKLATGLS